MGKTKPNGKGALLENKQTEQGRKINQTTVYLHFWWLVSAAIFI